MQVLSDCGTPYLRDTVNLHHFDVIDCSCLWGYTSQQSKSFNLENRVILGRCVLLCFLRHWNGNESGGIWSQKVFYQLVVLLGFLYCHSIGDIDLLFWDSALKSSYQAPISDDLFITLSLTRVENYESAATTTRTKPLSRHAGGGGCTDESDSLYR